jgi:sugar phosphate isomerase/epimerase
VSFDPWHPESNGEPVRLKVGKLRFRRKTRQGGSDEIFARRMDFARALGARIINTNAAKRTNAEGFFHHIQILAAHAERLEMIIGLENP